MTSRPENGILGLTPSQLAVFGGITLAASLGINEILKKQTKPKKENGASNSKKEENIQDTEGDDDLGGVPRLTRKNTVDLDREARNYRVKLEATFAHRNELLEELKFLEGPTSEIQKIPHLATLLEVYDFPKILSPLLGDSKYRSVFGGEGFLPEESFVCSNSYVLSHAVFGPKNPIQSTKKYLKAGPRNHIFFNPDEVRACIVTCGGLCPGLNVVIRELFNSLWYNYKVRSISGIRFGYKGFYTYDWVEMSPGSVKNIHNLGGTVLGSSRGGFDIDKIMNQILEKGINQIYCIGGDGTHRGIYELYKAVAERKLKISVVGIPKTIDNDILVIDKSFGVDTAVEEATKAIDSAHVEATAAENGIGLVKLMGRSAGFIAMYAALANRDVDICLIPEFPFEMDGPDGLLSYVKRRVKSKGYCVIVAAEGAGFSIRDADLSSEGVDASGNPKLPDVGKYLKDRITESFKQAKMELTLKYIDPTYMIRTVPANAFDKQVCGTLAQNAVHGAMSGWTGFTVGTVCERTCYIPLTDITSGKRTIPPMDRGWQRLLAFTGQPSFLNDPEILATCKVERKPTGIDEKDKHD